MISTCPYSQSYSAGPYVKRGPVGGSYWDKPRLAEVFIETKKACRKGYELNGRDQRLSRRVFKRSQKNTFVLGNEGLLEALKGITYTGKERDRVDTTVSNRDSIQAAMSYKKKGFRPLVVNFANATHPGGGVKNGAKAQEESLFRRSSYHLSLDPRYNRYLRRQFSNGTFFKIPEFGTILSRGVTVFRDTQENNFRFLKPRSLDFVASAAYIQGKNAPTDSRIYNVNMKEKMRAIFRTAILNGNDVVIAGAYGCGAFGNDPTIVSRLFREVLSEREFAASDIKLVDFAVLDISESQANLRAFKKELVS